MCPAPTSRSCSAWRNQLELEDGPAIENAAVREKLADWYVRSQGLKYTKYRTMTALSRGRDAGAGSRRSSRWSRRTSCRTSRPTAWT